MNEAHPHESISAVIEHIGLERSIKLLVIAGRALGCHHKSHVFDKQGEGLKGQCQCGKTVRKVSYE